MRGALFFFFFTRFINSSSLGVYVGDVPQSLNTRVYIDVLYRCFHLGLFRLVWGKGRGQIDYALVMDKASHMRRTLIRRRVKTPVWVYNSWTLLASAVCSTKNN